MTLIRNENGEITITIFGDAIRDCKMGDKFVGTIGSMEGRYVLTMKKVES